VSAPVPILFVGLMARAILDGRKLQTRRLVKPAPPAWATEAGYSDLTTPGTVEFRGNHPTEGPSATMIRCPYGQPGGRLWGRETLRRDPTTGGWHYGADNAPVWLPEGDPRMPSMVAWAHHKEGNTCTAIHMPRWASRIELELTEVRVQRAQQITEEDARWEGIGLRLIDEVPERLKKPLARALRRSRAAGFRVLWEEINGLGSWELNPWVWVLTFKRVTEGGDRGLPVRQFRRGAPAPRAHAPAHPPT